MKTLLIFLSLLWAFLPNSVSGQEDGGLFFESYQQLSRMQFGYPNSCFPQPCQLAYDSLAERPEMWITLSQISAAMTPDHIWMEYCLDTTSNVWVFTADKAGGYIGYIAAMYVLIQKEDSVHILSVGIEEGFPVSKKTFLTKDSADSTFPPLTALSEMPSPGFWVSSNIRSNRSEDRNISCNAFSLNAFEKGRPVYHFEYWDSPISSNLRWADAPDPQTLIRIRALLHIASTAFHSSESRTFLSLYNK